jgi:hypothetical protein
VAMFTIRSAVGISVVVGVCAAMITLASCPASIGWSGSRVSCKGWAVGSSVI